MTLHRRSQLPAGPPHRSRRDVERALRMAEARLSEAGERVSAPRLRALELLLEAGGPVRVYDLLDRFKAGGVTAPTTIYRAFEALAAAGLVHRVASLNAYVARQRPEERGAPCFLVCDRCGGLAEVASPPPSPLAASGTGGGFQVAAIEAHGRCGACAG